MIVQELFQKVTFNKIMKYLVSKREAFVPYEEVDDIIAYRKNVVKSYLFAYEELKNLTPILDENSILMVFPVFEDETLYYDVSLLKKDELLKGEAEFFGIDFIPWNEVLGFQISKKNLEEESLTLLAGEILWELTFYGYNNEDVSLEGDKVKEIADDAIQNLKEGNVDNFVSFDDFKKELNITETILTEEFKENMKKQMKKYQRMKKHYFEDEKSLWEEEKEG